MSDDEYYCRNELPITRNTKLSKIEGKRSKIKVFTYQWLDSIEDNRTIINIYGLNKDNKVIRIIVRDFTPFMFVKLPSNIKWSASKLEEVRSDLSKKLMFKLDEDNCKFCTKKDLYYANVTIKNTEDGDLKFEDILQPYLKVELNTINQCKTLKYKLDGRKINFSFGSCKLLTHQTNVDVIIQLTVLRKLLTAGWMEAKGIKIPKEKQESQAEMEFYVSWKDLNPVPDYDKIVSPLIMGFDIECYSSDHKRMPNSKNRTDVIFQISCCLTVQGSNVIDKYLLTLGEPDLSIIGKHSSVLTYETEDALLLGFTEFIQKHNPQVIVGYNIFNFDIPYLIGRANLKQCMGEFDKLGIIHDSHSPIINKSWESSAYKKQKFMYFDTHGRIFIDMMTIIKRDYNFNIYTLKYVSTYFLGETKDPLDARGIFRCYEEFTPKSMAIVGKYCIQDTYVTLKLFELLQSWIGLCEMASVCKVPILYIFTQGQQIKVFSQVFDLAYYNNYVINVSEFLTKKDEKFTGATVFDPIPGLYENVIPMDFTSLYPTTMISNNICYTTLIRDELKNDIDDNYCHTFEWEEHSNCCHDPKTNPKSKAKKVIKCSKFHYKFFKEDYVEKGILPKLLDHLLCARKETKKKMKEVNKMINNGEGDIEYLKKLVIVLDKRQLSFKVSANSVYGSMGTSNGYLPFLPGARCTTTGGRQAINKAFNYIQNNYTATVVYGDTDSCMVRFPEFDGKPMCELWDYALKLQTDIAHIFPSTMALMFEEAIYKKFIIFTKKRYIATVCNRDGVISDELTKKGVLLKRRDNSKFARDIYQDVIMMVFNESPLEDIVLYITNCLKQLYERIIPIKNLVITKSVNDVEMYKMKTIDINDKDRIKKMHKKGVDNDIDYAFKSLPAHVQLAEKMRRRGKTVDSGTRIEYVVTSNNGLDANQYDKIEEYEYFMMNSDIMNIEYLYYVKLLVNPIDQVLQVAFGTKNIVHKIYTSMLLKHKLNIHLRKLRPSNLVFVNNYK